MQFIIADTFTNSLAGLDSKSQRVVKQTVFDLQVNLASPGLKCHRVDKSLDRNFWSARVTRDLRIIFHKLKSNVTLCYAGHHDAAYNWAGRRRFEVHPTTGAAQIVEVLERVEERVIRRVREEHVNPPLLARYENDYLLALGVPTDWVQPVKAADEDQLTELLLHLPEEAMERLLELASGNLVPTPTAATKADPFAHADAQRRFRVVDSQDELRQALDFPYEKWIVFLHPSQRAAVERFNRGPARMSGAAGTGKTVVALHRAAYLARKSSKARVLLTTFSKTLASRVAQQADLLLGKESADRRQIEVRHLHKIARDFWVSNQNREFNAASATRIRELITTAKRAVGTSEFSVDFIRSEWDAIVDPWGIESRPRYKVVRRTGRGSRLTTRQRLDLWRIFQDVQDRLFDLGLMTWDQLCNRCAIVLELRSKRPYSHVVVDEAQDLGPAELRFVRSLAAEGPNDLFLCADAGQRIFKAGFPWLSTGVDVRGRSTRLKVNYRTTDQIRNFAEQLLPEELKTASGEKERRGSLSLLQGPAPEVVASRMASAEINKLSNLLSAQVKDGYPLQDIALFARTTELLKERAIPALSKAGLAYTYLNDRDPPSKNRVSIGTMHRAKGLEFRVIVALACDEAVLPLRSALDKRLDSQDQANFVEHERNLLYVACTRARERLYVTYSGKPSRYLDGTLKAMST